MLDIRLARTAVTARSPLFQSSTSDGTGHASETSTSKRRSVRSQGQGRRRHAEAVRRSPGRLRPGQGINRRVTTATATGIEQPRESDQDRFAHGRRWRSLLARRRPGTGSPAAGPPRQASAVEPPAPDGIAGAGKAVSLAGAEQGYCRNRRNRPAPQPIDRAFASLATEATSAGWQRRNIALDRDRGCRVLLLAARCCSSMAPFRMPPTCSLSSNRRRHGRGFLDSAMQEV